MPKKKTSASVAGAKITQAEWEVMQILWNADAPLSAAEVIDRLETKANWNPKTIRTFLSRLVQKRVVRAVKKSLAGYELLHYIPLIDRTSALQAKQATFADRFFGGTVHSMLAGCIQSGEISIDELRELREMIDSKIEEQ